MSNKKAGEDKNDGAGKKQRPVISLQDVHARILFKGCRLRRKINYMQEASRQMPDDPDSLHKEQSKKYANADEVEKKLNETDLAASHKKSNRSSKKKLTTAQRAAQHPPGGEVEGRDTAGQQRQ